MQYCIGALIGVLIYSAILTIVTIYKDNSGYFIVSNLDIIVAGPVIWIMILIGTVVSLIYKPKKKEQKYKPKSQKEIEKIVSKIMKRYLKKHRDVYISLDYGFNDEYGRYDGWRALMVRKPSAEWLDKKFESLIINQHKETVAELMKYFEPATPEMMKQKWEDDWFIEDVKNANLVVLK